ncbi:PA14 domain-containing protein [Cohnella rhizosphaerae]|uniref:PA14 domain-containing protein n=1 Tax=Cohnella rhizosphaerae TaxID=1457232 RepID=A0A9X4KTV0_9BACL|nr:PA14 domain-containing protein [Cohnella rhizosphaerae]MDG0810797.1 PA14 domain-containing protein [Cohnella rhizosphaerae]
MKRNPARTSRLLAAVLLWTSVFSGGYYLVQAAGNDNTTGAPAVVTTVASETGASLNGAVQADVGGQGLLGEYFAGTGSFDFGDYKGTTIDSQINFTNLDPVLQGMTGKQDSANARWTGRLLAPETGDYTFYMTGDNGFRLWIDDQPVIDHWVNDWDKEQTSAPVSLAGGTKHKIKIEYFEDFGGSNLYLRWSTPTIAKEIVPASAFYLPEGYAGPVSGFIPADGLSVTMTTYADLSAPPAGLKDHLTATADDQPIQILAAGAGASPASLTLNLGTVVKPGQRLNVSYDGQAGLQLSDGTPVAAFRFTPSNNSEAMNYEPIAIAMSLYGSAKTNRSFAWYTPYDKPNAAPANILDSIVEVVPAGKSFDSQDVKRYVGKPEETRVLTNLKITSSTTGSFISHKVLVDGLTPGTAYQYRVGNDGHWSEAGSFTTEGNDDHNYEFLYMTDSQGSNSNDYEVWANTLGNALDDYPNAKFMVMTGDQVDAGALESQWLDYFGKPQKLLMNLPLMAAVGNHEGPYNDNYYYHLNYPNNSIEKPLPPGSVYAFDYGDAHIMVLNTMDIGWDDNQKESFGQQIEWLKREVAQTDKKWKVVAFHKAIYSLGNHAKDTDILALRDTLYPAFDELGIDVVLQGHDHTFMRSYQMYGDKPVANIQKDASGNPLNPDGTLYMINNSAGTKYYNLQNGVDRYYAAVFEQPYKPIYSGIRMTEDSFTIDSYKSGEDAPFDTYTIVRKDGKPATVEELKAAPAGTGKTKLSWRMPASSADDAIRGFRIYEATGKLGANWSVYVPVAAGQTDYSYTVEGTSASKGYKFAVRSVDKRDNSDAAFASTAGLAPAAPTAPKVDDGRNTFGWTNVPGYDKVSDYEFSVDGGVSWQRATVNPQPVGDLDYAAGKVQVRVAADETAGTAEGEPLLSDAPFTVNGRLDTYQIAGGLKRGDKLEANVTVERLEAYDGDAYVVFQLLKGDTPQLINAVPLKKDKLSIAQYFDVSGAEYSVKVLVLDQFDSNLSLPEQLARAKVLQ